MRVAEHLSMFGPAPCASCGRRGSWLCATCSEAARPPAATASVPGVDRVVAPWAYEAGPRSLLLALKLRHLKAAARPLVDAMVVSSWRAGLDGACLTWVPARPRDRAERGFDHAEVLARGIAARTGLPAVALLDRRGVQLDQSGLDRAARLDNLEGAFYACGSVPERVILVDDLVTTGATVTACAAALKRAGATYVSVLAACRA